MSEHFGLEHLESNGETINPVLRNLGYVVENSTHVSVNHEKIEEFAQSLESKSLTLPDWKLPVFLNETNEDTIDFLFLGNTINFAYNDFETGKTYETEYGGQLWDGAYAMWVSLKRAVESRKLQLDGSMITINDKPLSDIERSDLSEVLETSDVIPMLEDRLDIFRETGGVLDSEYNGHFYNVIKAANGHVFDNGHGVVERLARDFTSYNDRASYKGVEIPIFKRAQLATAMVYERFLPVELFTKKGVDQITVFADYELPKVLNYLGVLDYEQSLDDRIKSGVLIEAGSEEEVEIRANTIYASELIVDVLNSSRTNKINALHLDYLLWHKGIIMHDKKAHLTKTTNY